MAKDKTPAECPRMCVKDGMKYALDADKKLYTLEGHETELSRLAGQRVTVKGILKGDTLSVQEVAASRRVEITITFDLTLESVPAFRLFSRRDTPCVRDN